MVLALSKLLPPVLHALENVEFLTDIPVVVPYSESPAALGERSTKQAQRRCGTFDNARVVRKQTRVT